MSIRRSLGDCGVRLARQQRSAACMAVQPRRGERPSDFDLFGNREGIVTLRPLVNRIGHCLPMHSISYARHRFPPVVIQHTVWLYLRFTLSYRDVEDLLAERGLDISYQTIRHWVLKFGPLYARNLRRRRPPPSEQWHLDEMVVMIGGRRSYLWRAVDDEGEMLDILVQSRRNKAAAVKLLRKLMKKLGFAPRRLVTDKLPSYGAAKVELGMTAEHERACARTIGRRTRTSRSDDGSTRCSGSNPPGQPNDSSPRTPPFTTPSTSSVI
jgi:transposase-like protein